MFADRDFSEAWEAETEESASDRTQEFVQCGGVKKMQHSYLNLYKSRGVVPSITEEDYNEIHNKEGVNNMNVSIRDKIKEIIKENEK